MERLFVLLVLGGFFLGLFSLSMILAGVVRIEKHLKRISEDLQMFINFYLQRK